MRALVQRVAEAEVTVAGQSVGRIGAGLLVLVCAMQGDDAVAADKLAARVAKLRIFRDAQDKMNLSLLDTGGAALVVSQFTLAADTRTGNRPGFSSAAPPAEGERLYLHFAKALRDLGVAVQTGVFGGDMQVTLVNDGPVTIWLDSADRQLTTKGTGGLTFRPPCPICPPVDARCRVSSCRLLQGPTPYQVPMSRKGCRRVSYLTRALTSSARRSGRGIRVARYGAADRN